MGNVSFNQEVIETFLENLERKVLDEAKIEECEKLRQQFVQMYDPKKIESLKKEDYFLGHGIKNGCMSYDLEWTTKNLGSIKGGSVYKFGYESDFHKIKDLIKKVININPGNVYDNAGSPSKEINKITQLSKEINGFKTGRTVIPKLLSIYFPQTFLPIFNDQDFFISKLLNSAEETESRGLDLYLDYNFRLLKAKEYLEQEYGKKLGTFEFAKLLYFSFPKEQATEPGENAPRIDDNHIFDALEVPHYQSLLHRNFNRLFPNLKYFDVETQQAKNGQYDTQVVGTMDILAIDDKGDFVVIEIKRRSTDDTIGQILRYMGWTKEELCKDKQKVRGIIVAESKDLKLDFALKVIPEVRFMKLSLSITLLDG